MSIPFDQLNTLFDTLDGAGIKIDTIIVDNLPRNEVSNSIYNQIITKYGIVTFETKSTYKRRIYNQLESFIKDSLSI